MENKKNTGLIILIIILVICLIGSIGYITYDKFLVKSEPIKEEVDTEEEVEDTTTNEESELTVADLYDSYIKKISSRKEAKQIKVNDTESYYLGTDNVLYSSSCTSDCTAVAPFEETNGPTLSGKKLPITDVVDAFIAYYGNGGLYKLYVIKTDGNIYEVDYSNNYNLNKLSLNNIISINQVAKDNSTSISATDIEGNIIDDLN